MAKRGRVEQLTDANYLAGIGRAGATLVVFTASWCPPCRNLVGETLPRLAAGLSSRVRFRTADVGDAPMAALGLQLRGLPTLAFYRDGLLVAEHLGAPTEPALKNWISGALDQDRSA